MLVLFVISLEKIFALHVLLSMHSPAVIQFLSHFYRTGKLRTFKKVLADKSRLTLLKSLGQERKLTDAGLESMTESISLVI